MKQLLAFAMIITIFSNCGGIKESIAKSEVKAEAKVAEKMLPPDFNPKETILLIEQYDKRNQPSVEKYLAENYHHKYEFVPFSKNNILPEIYCKQLEISRMH